MFKGFTSWQKKIAQEIKSGMQHEERHPWVSSTL
jgi:hypothetical protein